MKVTALVAAFTLALAGTLAGCGQDGAGSGASGGSSATSGSSGSGGSMGRTPGGAGSGSSQDPAKRSTPPASK